MMIQEKESDHTRFKCVYHARSEFKRLTGDFWIKTSKTVKKNKYNVKKQKGTKPTQPCADTTFVLINDMVINISCNNLIPYPL